MWVHSLGAPRAWGARLARSPTCTYTERDMHVRKANMHVSPLPSCPAACISPLLERGRMRFSVFLEMHLRSLWPRPHPVPQDARKGHNHITCISRKPRFSGRHAASNDPKHASQRWSRHASPGQRSPDVGRPGRPYQGIRVFGVSPQRGRAHRIGARVMCTNAPPHRSVERACLASVGHHA